MPGRIDKVRHNSRDNEDLIPLCHIITPVGMMGYGFDEELIEAELIRSTSLSIPTAIILDSGSTDSGPSKLALGTMTVPRDAYKRDLTKLMRFIDVYKVPLLFSSAGGDGSNAHVDEMRTVVEEIAHEMFAHRQFNTLSLYAEVSKTLVKERLDRGVISGCGSAVPVLTPDHIDSAPVIVAQMGCEPFLDAMFAVPDLDIVIGGRAYDPSPYVAYAAYHAMCSMNKMSLNVLGEKFLGGIFHMGKIMECGGLCASPKSAGAKATIYTCGTFDITPLAPNSRCTPLSVAAHTLYEKTRPDLLHGPGGCLDLRSSTYEQLDDNRSVRPRGAIFRLLPTADENYTVKLEGARIIGYRTIFMGSFRDPLLIRQLDDALERTKEFVRSQHKDTRANWKLEFHKYGDTDLETRSNREVFIVAEALADTQVLANSVASSARIAVTHGAYPGQKVTSGNFAFGLGGKNEFEAGPCAEFCVYHIMDLKAGEEGAREMDLEVNMSNVDNIADKSSKLFVFRQDIVGSKVEDDSTTDTVPENLVICDIQITAEPRSRHTSETNGDHLSPQKRLNNYPSTNGACESACETLGDVANILRSKNAGPYEITMDVMFDSPDLYNCIKNSGLLTPVLISKLFAIDESDIIYCGFFDQAMAFKATVPRTKGGRSSASGGYMENDVHGSQQYLPLMNLRLPNDLITRVQAIRLMSKS